MLSEKSKTCQDLDVDGKTILTPESRTDIKDEEKERSRLYLWFF
jgi:hypothetical protein